MKKSRQLQPPRPERGIPTELLQGMTTEEAEKFTEAWRNSGYVLDPIKRYIDRKLNEIVIDENEDYESPNWAYRRVDKNGQIKMLKKIRKLLP